MKYVYKIITAVISLATIPLLFFSDAFYYKVSSKALETVLYLSELLGGSLANNILTETAGKTPTGVADSTSVYDLINLFKSVSGLSEGSNESLQKLVSPVATLLLILALVAVCAVVTAVFAFAAKDNRKVIYGSIAGISLCVSAKVALESVAAPLVDGTLSTAEIFDSTWATFIGNIEEISLAPVFWLVPVLFLCAIVWTVLYNATLPEKEKLERKLMLGEAKEK